MKLPAPTRLDRMGGDDVGRGIESALAMLLFLGVGWAVDGWLGTRPLFTIVLVVLAFVGTFARTIAGYAGRMDALESERGGGANRTTAMTTTASTSASTEAEGT